MLKKYSQWAPTGHDVRGKGLAERQEWLVCPCTITRDSEALERSNFRVMLRTLGGESETLEVHRFGHWACGWLEIALISPDRASEATAIAERLADYSILDEMDMSELESEENV